jgi:hypothetical protein
MESGHGAMLWAPSILQGTAVAGTLGCPNVAWWDPLKNTRHRTVEPLSPSTKPERSV